MNILLWLVFGAISGYIASIVMRTNTQRGAVQDIILGILGAVIGGFLMNLIGFEGVAGFNFYSLLVAIVGASILIWLGRVVRSY